MGVLFSSSFLSKPITDKVSADEKCERLSYGASSMQGWRSTQEDAHNCIPVYDDNSSFFAVYDGHGGAEVAEYCSMHLPDFLRSLPQYKEGKFVKSLETAFIEFDALLTKQEVIVELKRLARMGDASELDEDEIKVLNEEADMPLEKLLARYKSGAKKGEKLQTPINDSSKKNITEENEETMVNGENETKCDRESHSVKDDEVKSKKLKEDFHDKLEKGDNLETPQLKSDAHLLSDCGREDTGTNGDSSNTEKEQSDHVECNKMDDSSDKQLASSSSMRKKKGGGPLLDLEDSDTSDDNYGESGSSSEEDNEEWNKLEDNDGEEEEEEDEEEDEEEEHCHNTSSVGETIEPGIDSGCTAVISLIRGNQLYVANAGDSRCVVSREGKALDMSCDHKPEDEAESIRIKKAGGQVSMDGRVNGGLNLSRAFGDHSYKQRANFPPEEQMITAFPDVRTHTLDDKDEFMVLACDGIWNVMSSQEVVDFIKKRIDLTEKLSTICEELFDNCLSPHTLGDGTGCDNMTCIIIKFHNLGSSDSAVGKRPCSPEEDNPEAGKKIKVNADSS